MKSKTTFCRYIFVIFYTIGIFTGCTKETQPEMYGNWQMIDSKGMSGAIYDYQIDASGVCASNRQYFGSLSVCAPFELSGNQMTVLFDPVQVWTWQFYNTSTAKIKIEAIDGKTAEIILTRK